jgi:hypothetical protein
LKSRRTLFLGCVIVAAAALVVAFALRDSEYALDSYVEQAENLGRAVPSDSSNSDIERLIAKGNASLTDGDNEVGEIDSEHRFYPQPDNAPNSWAPVLNDEALPCTRSGAPANFETYSVGPSIHGLPLTHTERRCGTGPVAARVNYLSYIYGDCQLPPGETGCRPPLEIQTWPACQRYLAKYSFRGKPLPHRFLSTNGDAEVVEFSFLAGNRIEVYTNASTVVIFAPNRDRAVEAVEMLRPEEEEEPPASTSEDLRSEHPDRLEPPERGSLEGTLSC